MVIQVQNLNILYINCFKFINKFVTYIETHNNIDKKFYQYNIN